MRVLSIVLSILLVSFMPLQSTVTPADIVFKNGNVYTADNKTPQAEAIAVKADRIVFVGSNADAQKHVGPNTRVVDLKGAFVFALPMKIEGGSGGPVRVVALVPRSATR